MSTIPYATEQNITSLSWSLCLDSSAGGQSGAGIGKVVQGIADIHQCLKILFGTIPGQDPFRPTFGVDLTAFLDMPISVALPAIVATVTAAVKQWEPRLTLQSISAAYSQDNPGRLGVTVVWQPNTPSAATSAIIGNQTTSFNVGGVSSQS